jgi:hypothetical protein
MIVRRYRTRTGEFEPIQDAMRARLLHPFVRPPSTKSEKELQQALRRAKFGQLSRFVEPRFRATNLNFPNDIWSGCALTPVSGTVSFVNGVWTIPTIRTPLWVTKLVQQFPEVAVVASSQDALALLAFAGSWSQEEVDVYNSLNFALNYGFSVSSWAGIGTRGGGDLVQAGVISTVPVSTWSSYQVPTWSTTVGGDGLVSEYNSWFQWFSGGTAQALPFGVSAGDTVHVFLQIVDIPYSNYLPVGDPSNSIPLGVSQAAFVYFGNLTQDTYTAFVVFQDEYGSNLTPVPFARTALWIVEQGQVNLGTEHGRAGQTSSDFVQPFARYGSIFFAEAVCGQWQQPEVGANPLAPSVSPTPTTEVGYTLLEFRPKPAGRAAGVG